MQEQPLYTNIVAAMPEKDAELEKLMSFPDPDGLKLYTQCFFCSCALGEFFFGGSSQCSECACVDAKNACLCCDWTFEKNFCQGAKACFCLKCCVVADSGIGCPLTQFGQHQCGCFQTNLETNCASASQSRDCCSQAYSNCVCLQKTEDACYGQTKCLCCVQQFGILTEKYPCGLAILGKRIFGGKA